MRIQSYNYAANARYPAGGGDSWKKTVNAGDFQCNTKVKVQDTQNRYLVSEKKNEILNKFPALTEEKLDQIARDYDIENMNEEELFELAGKLAEDGVIPPRPEDNGLNQIVVFPKELYDAILRGEMPQPAGVVREASGFLYSVNASSGEMEFSYPDYGIRSLQYNLEMCQNAFKRFEGYYTNEELERQIQLTNSKARFLEFAQLLVEYREEVQG